MLFHAQDAARLQRLVEAANASSEKPAPIQLWTLREVMTRSAEPAGAMSYLSLENSVTLTSPQRLVVGELLVPVLHGTGRHRRVIRALVLQVRAENLGPVAAARRDLDDVIVGLMPANSSTSCG